MRGELVVRSPDLESLGEIWRVRGESSDLTTPV
jgi:hypothetical protein